MVRSLRARFLEQMRLLALEERLAAQARSCYGMEAGDRLELQVTYREGADPGIRTVVQRRVNTRGRANARQIGRFTPLHRRRL